MAGGGEVEGVWWGEAEGVWWGRGEREVCGAHLMWSVVHLPLICGREREQLLQQLSGCVPDRPP